MVGKFASIFGPLLMAIVPFVFAGSTNRDSILVLVILLSQAGFCFIAWMSTVRSRQRGHWTTRTRCRHCQPPETVTGLDIPLSRDTLVDSRKGPAMFYMVVSSVVMSFGGLILRSLETTEPLQVSFHRSLGLLGAVIVFLLIRYRRESIQVTRNIGWPGVVGGGLLGCAGLAHLQAMANTTIANSTFILGSIPFFTALFAWVLLKEKLQRRTLVAMLIAAVGLGVMVKEGMQIGAGYGIIMAILTAVCFSVFAVIVRSRRRVQMLPSLIVSSLVIMAFSAIATKGDIKVSYHDALLCIIWGAVLSGIANFLFLFAPGIWPRPK